MCILNYKNNIVEISFFNMLLKDFLHISSSNNIKKETFLVSISFLSLLWCYYFNLKFSRTYVLTLLFHLMKSQNVNILIHHEQTYTLLLIYKNNF